ncbi:MAG: hypothetical protein ACRDJH_10675 [Thermomicrobiales bacterium]
MFATAFLACLSAAIILTPLGFLWRSWIEVAAAAGLSMVVVVITTFSFGPFIFALTCFELSAAVALRMSVGWRGWALALLGAALVWAAAVPLPLHTPNREPWQFAAVSIPLTGLFGAVMLLIAGRHDRRPLTPSS